MKNKTIRAIDPTESLPNGPVLLKLPELQLALPVLEFLRAGLPKTEPDQRDSTLRRAVHFLKTPHLPEMPNSKQDQLEKINCQSLGRHGKTLHKVQAQQCLRGRNEIRNTEHFAEKGGGPRPDPPAKGQLRNK